MSSDMFKRHVSRLKSSLAAHSPDTICDFITNHTYLNGKKFTFEGHEYQKTILEDPSDTIVIAKSAQLGISEMSARLALARSVLQPGFSTIYTLPSATAAQSFMKTRVTPVVDGSPYLSELVSKDVDNASVKRFGDSYLFLKGCQVDRQAISVPADMCVFDEVNNSDQNVMTLFESRLIHSKFALRVFLSTPSIPDFGIDKLFKQSKRKLNMAQCDCCNEWFLPDYHDHVKIPGFNDPLEKITKSHFADPNFLWMEAYVECPKCKSSVDLRVSKREWVVENPDEAFTASGYQVSPFECPTIIKPSHLVKSSVDYERPVDFYNQRLGKSLEDRETSISLEDLLKITIKEVPGVMYSYVMGLDMGSTCWAVIAAVMLDQTLVVVKTEAIPLHRVVERTSELTSEFQLRMIVIDRGPMTEAVYQIQQKVRNSFAAVFVQSKGIELFKITDRQADKDKGVEDMRQVNIAKDAILDVIMSLIRIEKILKVSDANDNTFYAHLMDNKRIQMFKNDELTMTWVKTSKQDHLHMALAYCMVASRILGVSVGLHAPLPLISTFRVKPK